MESPSVPLLVALIVGLGAAAGVRARRMGALGPGDARVLVLLAGGLVAWLLLSAVLAYRGVYLDPQVLHVLPLLQGFAVPVAAVSLCLWRSARCRAAVGRLVASLPVAWLVGVHAVRVAALGTILALGRGELPAHFILPVAVPDFGIGLTALPLARWAARAPRRAARTLFAWNGVGAALFLPAGILLHVSMPGPVMLFSSGPTTEPIFRFPLALVPTFLVPCFVGIHAACLWRLARTPPETW